jgi:hypothetical protein|tara:strand:+ start:12564 stop:12824 length:261 start_codon:yes stop_codon:yes gene_type:complete
MIKKEKEVFEHKIMTKKRFSMAVEKLVSETKNVSYIDAAVMIIEERGMPYTNLKRLLSDSLKSKIEEEASSLNLIRGKKIGNKLPI